MSFYEVYTNDILAEIEKQSNLLFTPKSIAVNLEIDFEDFKENLKNKNHDAYIRFWKGVATREFTIKQDFLDSSADNILSNELKMKEFSRFKGKVALELYG